MCLAFETPKLFMFGSCFLNDWLFVTFLAAQVPGEGPAQVMEVVLPLIRCGDYVYGGGRWEAWRKKHPEGSFVDFVARRNDRMQ